MKTTNETNKKTAKNYFLVLFALAAIVMGYVAYDQYNQNQETKEFATAERIKMKKYYFDSYAQIEQNLSEINAHEGVIRANISGENTEGPLSPEERVQQEIEIIKALMNENNRLISELNAQVIDKDKQLDSYSGKIANLNKRVKNYETKLAEFTEANKLLAENLLKAETENSNLHQDLELQNHQIKEQTQTLDQQSQLISDQANGLKQKDQVIHTAYYLVGSYQDLKESDVLEKQGGIAGIGGTKNLKANFNKNQFVKIDKREYTMIPVYSKKAELVTNHSSDTYEWFTDENGIAWLKIKDTEKFWETNKYLVIVTKDGLGGGLAQNKY